MLDIVDRKAGRGWRMAVMQDGGAGGRWDPRTDRKAYVVWMALVLAAVSAGFASDFARYLTEQPAPPLILHVHGAIYFAWLVLVVGQIWLVEKGDIRLHRTLGWATAGVAVVMVPMGLAAAFVDEARRLGQPSSDPQFLALEFEEMIAFSAFTVAGVLLRKDPAAHKRLMILSAVAISDAGFGRIWSNWIKLMPPGVLGWWVQYFWGIGLIVLAMIGWDLWRRRRVHPAVWAGAVLLAVGELATSALQFSPGWKAAMTAAVKAWGYTG